MKIVFIVGHDVHPSNEASMVSKKLDQVSKIVGEVPKNALFDTGYFYNTPIEECNKRDIKIYCAEKKGTPFTH